MATFLQILVVALTTVTPVSAAPVWPDIPARVVEAAGVDRSGWPLAVIVPFARGVARPQQPLALRVAGNLLPTQARPLVTWPDGSLRWVRLDSVISLRAGQTVDLTVVSAAPPAPATALRIVDTAKGIAIDTGAVSFEIPRDRFAIVDQVRTASGGAAIVGAVSASMIADSRVYSAAAPRSVRVTDSGPLHGGVELRGAMGPEFEYLIRLEVAAGSPFIRILHTYTKVAGRSETAVERMSIDVPFAAPLQGRYAVGVDRGKPILGDLGEDTSLLIAQVDNLSYQVGGDRREGRLAGWFESDGRAGAIGLAARWFWQEYPKAVSLGPLGITFDLWSPKGGVARVGIGSAKTHEFVLWAAAKGAVGRASAGAVATPLRAVIAPTYLARSGALRNAINPEATTLDDKLLQAALRYTGRNAREVWQDCGQAVCDGGDEATERTGAFGMMNWGDWNFPGAADTVKGTDAWGNLEYDTTQVLALTYAATGDAAVLDAMEAAARHFMDVDTIHAAPNHPEWVGMNHPKNPRHFAFDLGGVDLGHTWAEGLLSYYQLTGDERGLQVASGIADYLVRRLPGTRQGNPRQWGWPQIALVAVADVTGETRYLDAARGYATAGMKAHPPMVRVDWKQGVLADALAYTHAHGGGAEIEAWLVAYAGKVVASRPRDARFYPAVAYAGRIAGKPEWVEIARRRIQQVDLGSWGKPFTLQGRLALRIENLSQAAP